MHLVHQIEIARSPEALWPWLDDSKKLAQWMKGIVEDVPLTPPPKRVGSKSTMRIREGMRVVDYSREITAYEPPRTLGVAFSGGSFRSMVMNVRFELEPLASSTRMTITTECEAVGPMKWMGWLFKLFARRQMRGFGRKLKELAER